MKVSIRFSILSILLILLLGVSAFIITVNYYDLNKFFITASQNYLSQASNKASAQVSRYLDPLNRRPEIAAKLIASNLVDPKDSRKFVDFLYDFLGAEGLYGIDWGDGDGNYFGIKKSDDDKFVTSAVTMSDQGRIETNSIFNLNRELLKTQTQKSDYDPRLRPWYQMAKYTKASTWFIYPIMDMVTGVTELGVAGAVPVYNKDKVLYGVFSLVMPLTTITNYVRKIDVTANSVAMIVDDVGHLITAYSATESLVNKGAMPRITDIDLPWVEYGFSLYLQNAKPAFEFNYNHNRYVAAFAEISATKGEHKWFVGVITPLQDIIAPLQRTALISLLIILGAIFIGIICALIFATRLSKPINKLAADADLICQMQLNRVSRVTSYIKEIAQMADAFIKMKNALYSFRRYMPVTLIQNLMSTGKIAEVGGETKELTIVFTDIQNFTPLSEKMLPADLTQYLSEYFQVVTKVVQGNFGTIDKYMGDGVMVFWGAPLDDPQHAVHACKTALQLQEAFKQLNLKWQAENKPTVATRIGINTGSVVVGNIGSDDRLSYTAVGDAVNLATRLESLNKKYHTYTMISEFTYAMVKDEFNCRLIDKVMVKGKQQGIYVYELLSEKAAKHDSQLEYYNDVFAQAFNTYETGQWDVALQLFTELAKRYPDDNLLQIFIDRCTIFKKQPPQNWSGTWTVEEK